METPLSRRRLLGMPVQAFSASFAGPMIAAAAARVATGACIASNSSESSLSGRAPDGVDVAFARAFPGGNGADVRLADVEQGWYLDHEDLPRSRIRHAFGINLARAYGDHGTAVLNVIVGLRNDRGADGLAPAASVRTVSIWRRDRADDVGAQDRLVRDTAGAIRGAARLLRPGDVMLIEIQTSRGLTADLPVEVDPEAHAAIRAATEGGITVIEPAGNGSFDLDLMRDDDGRPSLRRASADFRESGAIVVAGATAAAPHRRWGASNFGSRVDCFARGERIRTAWSIDGTRHTYTDDFGGTSGAAAIVAGVALVVQGIVRAAGRPPLQPSALRAILSDARLNTGSADPATDRIGVMPDLRRIILDGLGLPEAPVATPA